MAITSITGPGASLGTSLQALLLGDDIQPGSSPSYELCKTIYLYHPLGAKIAEKPIEIAQSQKRKISVPNSPEQRVVEAFEEEWDRINADAHIFNTTSLSRVYGIASVALMQEGVDTNKPVDFWKLAGASISFNVYDPLNTAGSLVLNENPLAIDFQHTTEIRVSNSVFHRSRTKVIMNERPIYISYTPAAFGFVGRSVYQRALYPLKSFINTMIADDMVARKAGIIVTKLKQPGSIIDNAMKFLAGVKRNVVKEAENYNVISVGDQDTVESINLQNLEGPLREARQHILENIASAVPMPAKMLTDETFAEGFGEGTEDAKDMARYVDRVRLQMLPLYAYFDRIVRHRAWNEEFYATIQKDFSDYRDVDYKTAFYRWTNSFVADWPSLLKEPDSELVKVDDVKLRATIAMVQVLGPLLDPTNRATLVEWAAENFNDLKLLFTEPLILNTIELEDYVPPEEQAMEEPKAGHPFAAQDAVADFHAAVKRLGKPDRITPHALEDMRQKVMGG